MYQISVNVGLSTSVRWVENKAAQERHLALPSIMLSGGRTLSQPGPLDAFHNTMALEKLPTTPAGSSVNTSLSAYTTTSTEKGAIS
jgi:hypothetical protein